MAKRPPRLGDELPAYTTMGATKPKKTRRVMAFPNPLASTRSGKNVVQWAPQENTDMRGTIKFAPRTPGVMPGNSSQRMPGGAKRITPRKPAK